MNHKTQSTLINMERSKESMKGGGMANKFGSTKQKPKVEESDAPNLPSTVIPPIEKDKHSKELDNSKGLVNKEAITNIAMDLRNWI